MSANVEDMAYVRETPWHGLGTKVEGLMTVEDALAAVPVLASEVQKEPVYTGFGEVVPNLWANVRQADRKIVGTVGDSFVNVQTRDAFAWANLLLDDGSAKIETVGSLMGGRRVFASLELPDGIQIAGLPDEAMQVYLLISNGFDGMTKLRADVTLVRTVCTNTWTAAVKGAKRSFAIRHTGSIEGKIAVAKEALGITHTYAAAFQKVAETLVAKSLVDRQIEEILRGVFPVPVSQDTPERIDQSDFAKVLDLYRTSDNLDNIRGTGWSVLQAVGEFLDHETDYRGRRFDAASVKMDSIVYGGPAALRKQETMDRILAIR